MSVLYKNAKNDRFVLLRKHLVVFHKLTVFAYFIHFFLYFLPNTDMSQCELWHNHVTILYTNYRYMWWDRDCLMMGLRRGRRKTSDSSCVQMFVNGYRSLWQQMREYHHDLVLQSLIKNFWLLTLSEYVKFSPFSQCKVVNNKVIFMLCFWIRYGLPWIYVFEKILLYDN